MGKFVSYVLIGIAVVALYSMLQIDRSDLSAGANTSFQNDLIQSQDLAISGVEYAMRNLADDGSWANSFEPTLVTMDGLNVRVARTNALTRNGAEGAVDNARFVTSTSKVGRADVTLQAVIEVPDVDDIPTALRYALFSSRSLELRGDVLIRDDNNLHRNADIHTNQHLLLDPSVNVKGHGTFSGSLLSSKDEAVQSFHPNQSFGSAVIFKHPYVSLPEIDPSRWDQSVSRTFLSNTTLNERVVLGSKDKPAVWHIEGNLDLNAEIEGCGILLVDGDLRLSGRTSLNSGSTDQHSLLIVVAGNVFAEGPSDVTAAIVCRGDFLSRGEVIIIGSVTAGGMVENLGTLDLYYRPIRPELAHMLWRTKQQDPIIVSFYES